MDKIKRLFLEEILRALKEDIPRDEKWLKENQILTKISDALKNTKPTDIVFENQTQDEIFKSIKAVAVSVPDENLTVYFAYRYLRDYTDDSFAAYNALTKKLYVWMQSFDFGEKDSLSDCIKEVLNFLQRDDAQAIIHHELAHKLFADNFNDLQKLFKFKLKWFQIDYHKRPEEYNSFLSEIYDYAIEKRHLSLDSEAKCIKFALDLLNSESPYLRDLGGTISNLDTSKLSLDLLRFSRNKMAKEIFSEFKDYLIKNNLKFKTYCEMLTYAESHTNEPIIKKFLGLQNILKNKNFYDMSMNLIYSLTGKEFKESTQSKNTDIDKDLYLKLFSPSIFSDNRHVDDIVFIESKYLYLLKLIEKFEKRLSEDSED